MKITLLAVLALAMVVAPAFGSGDLVWARSSPSATRWMCQLRSDAHGGHAGSSRHRPRGRHQPADIHQPGLPSHHERREDHRGTGAAV